MLMEANYTDELIFSIASEEIWHEIGGIADYEFVDFSGEGEDDVDGFKNRIEDLGYFTSEEIIKLGGWKNIMMIACEFA
jgi:hypothetical protein